MTKSLELLRLLEEKQKIKAYHGSNSSIARFDRDFSAQGVFWFSEDKESILKGESGASSINYLIEVMLTVSNPAGWKEYDQLGLGQIKSQGFDSIHLDNDWVIFNNKNIKILNVIKLK